MTDGAPTGGNQVHVWENTYIMEPKEEEKFLPSKVTEAIERTVEGYFKDRECCIEDAKIWTMELSNEVKAAVKELHIPRHKIIVQVVVGEQASQGVRVASKCLWDASSDNWASYTYQNNTIWAVCMVFGCYYE
eukprot:TRINITY_DN2027_c0_g1_i1.p2 TRINITY_DN2027_c0_g1~~TRINITY_DN2027_c0_g1_i1.p2  ORF type:complete len:133 (+),score=33.64 TRINITY_DN2027_c0_g1_i1:113-511(+)